jgi:membrane-bound ClpP family serine protease
MAVSPPDAEMETPPSVDPEEPNSEKPTAPPPPWFELFDLDHEAAKSEEIQSIVNRDITELLSGDPAAAEYNVRILYDSRSIGRGDADRIYRSLRGVDRERPILLVVKSPGGSISAAFFVAKVCRESTVATFAVAVPREAKSAATLICCGADQIHMGSLSELGPVDPQFGAIPALALKHSIEHLAELAAQHPAAATMLTDYLARTLRIEALGYYERVAASAVQYAARLLNSRVSKKQSADEIERLANHLVYAYKDHGFVIDSREATEIFGNDVISCNTPEYELANKIYGRLDLLEYIIESTFGRSMAFTGAADSAAIVFRPRASE